MWQLLQRWRNRALEKHVSLTPGPLGSQMAGPGDPHTSMAPLPHTALFLPPKPGHRGHSESPTFGVKEYSRSYQASLVSESTNPTGRREGNLEVIWGLEGLWVGCFPWSHHEKPDSGSGRTVGQGMDGTKWLVNMNSSQILMQKRPFSK